MNEHKLFDDNDFSGCEEVEVARVRWPQEGAAQGKGAAQIAMTLAALGQIPALPVGVSADTVGGTVAVLRDTRIVRYQPLADMSMPRVHVTGASQSVVEDPGQCLVFVPLTKSPAVLELSDGRCLSLRTSDTGDLVVSELRLPVKSPASVHPPALADEVRGSAPWLSEAVSTHLSRSDAWHNAVAAGLTLRLGPLPAREALQSGSTAPQRWMATLSDDQRITVMERAVARVDGLWGELEGLRESLAPEDDAWRKTVIAFCRRRDDLEGVRVLLNWNRAGDRLEDVLTPFDRAAERFVRSIPLRFSIDNPQLRRAGIISPQSWWVRLQPNSVL